MSNKIVLGKTYKNEYGDERIPVLSNIGRPDSVFYIERRSESEPFKFNPYTGLVTIVTFVSKYRTEEWYETMPKEKLEKIQALIPKYLEQWKNLMESNAKEIASIMAS